jgi:hypothetical protein
MRALSAVLLATAFATPAMAQVLTSPPKGIILPNYDLIRIGQTEAIESGAVTARATGPLANVYNPAGLAGAAKTEVNASSTGYQLTKLGLEGVGQDVSSSRLANLGGFLGVVIADPLIKSNKWRLGFSIYSPLSWEPGTLSGAAAAQINGQAATLDYRTQVRLRAQIPSLAAGINLSRSLRLGLGFQVPIVSILQQQQTAYTAYDGTEAAAVSRAFAVDGSAWLVRGTLGLQWDVTPKLSLGVMAQTATARLWGSTFYSDQVTTAFGDGFETLNFRDPDARFEYKLPFLLSGGAALKLGKVQLEADVRWYSSVDQFDMYSSDSTGFALRQMDGGLPQTSEVELAPVTMIFSSVVNLSIGASIPIAKNWQLHAGFSTDESPLPDTNQLFRKVSLIGATAGVSFQISKVSGALGIGFQSGKSPTTVIGIAPTTLDTKLTVKTFQLLYSLAYTF